MNVHKNAGLTPIGRGRIVELARRGQTPAAFARARCGSGLPDTNRKAWPA